MKLLDQTQIVTTVPYQTLTVTIIQVQIMIIINLNNKREIVSTVVNRGILQKTVKIYTQTREIGRSWNERKPVDFDLTFKSNKQNQNLVVKKRVCNQSCSMIVDTASDVFIVKTQLLYSNSNFAKDVIKEIKILSQNDFSVFLQLLSHSLQVSKDIIGKFKKSLHNSFSSSKSLSYEIIRIMRNVILLKCSVMGLIVDEKFSECPLKIF